MTANSCSPMGMPPWGDGAAMTRPALAVGLALALALPLALAASTTTMDGRGAYRDTTGGACSDRSIGLHLEVVSTATGVSVVVQKAGTEDCIGGSSEQFDCDRGSYALYCQRESSSILVGGSSRSWAQLSLYDDGTYAEDGFTVQTVLGVTTWHSWSVDGSVQ